MNSKKYFLILLVVLGMCSCVSIVYADDPKLELIERDGTLWAGEGWMREYDGLKVFYFTGSPKEIGMQHGLLMIKPEMEKMLQVFTRLQDMAKTGNWFVDLFKDFYAKIQFVPAFKRYIPAEYLEELRGFKYSLAGHERITDLVMANAFQDLVLKFGCSAFAAWGQATPDGELIVGRNLDYLNLKDLSEYQALCFYRPESGIPFVTLNYPSFVGVMHGMNAEGITVSMNYSTVVKEEESVDGVPFTIMLRQVLQYAHSLEEAIQIIKETPRTVGLNIMLGDGQAKRAVVLEISANRMQIKEMDEFLYATNHFETSYMQEYQFQRWMNSDLRDERFQLLKEDSTLQVDLVQAIDLLRDKNGEGTDLGNKFYSGIDNAGTMASMVFLPAKSQIWVANPVGDRTLPDGYYLGFDASKIWDTGKPGGYLGKIDATPETDFYTDWETMMVAEAIFQKQDYQKVVELLEPVVTRNPEAENVLYHLGFSYLKNPETRQKGKEIMLRFITLPQIYNKIYEVNAYYLLGQVSDLSKDRQQAVKYYQKVLQLITTNELDYPIIQEMATKGLTEPLK